MVIILTCTFDLYHCAPHFFSYTGIYSGVLFALRQIVRTAPNEKTKIRKKKNYMKTIILQPLKSQHITIITWPKDIVFIVFAR